MTGKMPLIRASTAAMAGKMPPIRAVFFFWGNIKNIALNAKNGL